MIFRPSHPSWLLCEAMEVALLRTILRSIWEGILLETVRYAFIIYRLLLKIVFLLRIMLSWQPWIAFECPHKWSATVLLENLSNKVVQEFFPPITAINPPLHVGEPIMLARDLSHTGGCQFSDQRAYWFSLVMCHNSLIIFCSDN